MQSIRERVKFGLAAAKARGIVLGCQVGQRSSGKKAKKVFAMHRDGLSYRLIGRNLGLSMNTVMEIVRRKEHRDGDRKAERDVVGSSLIAAWTPWPARRRTFGTLC